MTRDDIIRMAREAGFFDPELTQVLPSVERFAALVAAAERERIKELNAPVIKAINEHMRKVQEMEREACAQVCDARSDADGWEGAYADECAHAIRARGQG